MIILKKYQQKAVAELLEKTYKIIRTRSEQQGTKLVFKAPTGAGKTVVMAAFLKQLAEDLASEPDLPHREFAYIWIAPNQLHLQSYRSLQRFFEHNRVLRPIQFNGIDEMCLHHTDLLFLNWQSISNEKNLLVRENEQGRNLDTLIFNTLRKGRKIIVILDEAHLFGTKGKKALEVLETLKGMMEIDVSATPLQRSNFEVIVDRHDVVEEEMIKKSVVLNPAVKPEEQEGDSLTIYLLKQALKKREALAAAYEAAGTNINPLLLIQLPSDTKKQSTLDKTIRENVVAHLEHKEAIATDYGNLAIWLSDGKDKVNLEDIEKEDSPVKVLLFKQAIALGWNCPRAAVLLIYREIKQQTFTIQTVGRILRMPEHKHYEQELLNVGHVYTDLSRNAIVIVRDEMDYFLDHTARRKSELPLVNIASDYLQRKKVRNRLGAKFKQAMRHAIENTWNMKNMFQSTNHFEENRQRAKEIFLDLNIQQLELKVIKEGVFDELKVGFLAQTETATFEENMVEIMYAFRLYCRRNCGSYAPVDSGGRIEGALKVVFEEYFSVEEHQTMKVVLHPNNQPAMQTLIRAALAAYGEIMAAIRSDEQDVKIVRWEPPVALHYSQNYEAYPVKKNLYEPFYIAKRSDGLFADSSVELAFIQYLEQHADVLTWWHKNTVGGQDSFSVVYENLKGKKSSFFVDFILLFKNNVIGLFDTKTLASDAEMVGKQNALANYVRQQNESPTARQFVGGVIVPNEAGTWLYPSGEIDNNFDSSTWQVLDLKQMGS